MVAILPVKATHYKSRQKYVDAKLGPNLVRDFEKLVRSGARFGSGCTGFQPKWSHGDPKQPNSFLGNRIWVYVGHILPNLLETAVLWVQMVKLKRCAPKNGAENRWNFVKWINGDPKSTRKLDWILGRFAAVLHPCLACTVSATEGRPLRSLWGEGIWNPKSGIRNPIFAQDDL